MSEHLSAVQVERKDWYSCDDVGVVQMYIEHRGTYVPQHSHTYNHLSMLATGAVRVWKDGKLMGDFAAPQGIEIEAGCKHKFLSLVDETIIYCIHNLHGALDVDANVQDEHQLEGV